MRFQGSFVAIVTPMKGGAVDLGALRALCEWQLAEGTQGLVPCGTTGEGATLTPAERREVIAAAVAVAKGKAVVIAGCGSNDTRDAIEQVRQAQGVGADAALVVTPYYNKPTQEGLYQHYQAVHQATRFPLVAYNVPSRTSVDMLPDTVARLARAGAVVGIKEATANMARQVELVRQVGEGAIDYLSGDDFTILPYIACGGHGVISVVANVIPRATRELVDLSRRGEMASARERQVAMEPLNRSLFCETNPGPVKYALHAMGRIGPELRLPLVPVAEGSAQKVREALKGMGIRVTT
jgi:4-hydroxy-tetrahydrodipicolinate synthase